MLPLLLLFLMQGVPVAPSQSGTITGVLTTSAGKPAVGVRVSALTKPDSPTDALMASAMASISQTDENGAYRLENVPPGRYYIVAGRIDQPTYFPGSLDMAGGRDVLITPGAAVAGIDFTLKDNSTGRADFGVGGAAIIQLAWTIPIQVQLEGGGKIPIVDGGQVPALRLTRVSDNSAIDVPLTAADVTIPFTATPEYRVSVENLSNRYSVKTLLADKTNLLSDTLKLSTPVPGVFTTGNPPGGFQGIFLFASGNNALTFTTTVSAGGTIGAPTLFSLPPAPTIELTLTENPPPPHTGATVSGTMPSTPVRNIAISGIFGSVYADGSFEIKNVPPGRHIILTPDIPLGSRPLGGVIEVDDLDLTGIELRPILEIPRDWQVFTEAVNGKSSAGLVTSLATVQGHLLNEETGTRFDVGRTIGRITVNGNTVSYTINNTGDFEIQNLLPGRYDLELWLFGGRTYTRTLQVGSENMSIEWPVLLPD